MDGPPVWLLDIDGVLNAISARPEASVWPAESWIRAEAGCAGVDWPLLVAGPVLDFIRDVHEAGSAEIRWHTTWQDAAVGVARALRLPEFLVQPCPEFTSYQEQRLGGAAPTGALWWKLPAAERVIGQEDRPVVWTDDDIDLQLRGYGQDHPILRTPTVLTVCPRTHIGLAPKHLRVIGAFLQGWAGHTAEDEPARQQVAEPVGAFLHGGGNTAAVARTEVPGAGNADTGHPQPSDRGGRQ